MKYDQDRIDGSTLATLVEGGFSGIGPFKFVAPDECLDEPKRRGGKDAIPGVYLSAWGSSSGGPHPYGLSRALTPHQARDLAEVLDEHDAIGFCCDGPDMEDWPHSYVEIIERFYAALGRRMERAITASAERAAQLREVRAALTGEVSRAS